MTMQPVVRSGDPSVKFQPTLTVHTLSGHKHIAMAARCLASLVRFSQEPAQVVLHEDGSLTEEDRELFRSHVPRSTFIGRQEADGPMNEFLGRYPACRKTRDNLVLALKLFDVQLLGSGECLAFADSDVLFVRPYAGLFEMPPDPTAGGVFMQDQRQGYCVTPLQLLRTPGLRLASRINSGLLYFRRTAFDWDLMEWFLKHDEFSIHPYWKEQTAWSVMAAATRSWRWDVRQVRVIAAQRDLEIAGLTVAHFVSSYRSLIGNVPLEGIAPHAAPLTIRCSPGRVCGFGLYVKDELQRKSLRAIRRFRNLAGFRG